MIEYKLVREKRKTLGIYITEDARVIVKVPQNISKEMIEKFILKKADWIERYRIQRQMILSQEPKYNLKYGGEILLLGEAIPVLKMSEKGMRLSEEALYVQDNADFEKSIKIFGKLIKDFAKEYFSIRLDYYGGIMGLSGYSLRVNKAKKQWGSCNTKKIISLSLRLIGADKELIDYVIVHELAHLVYMNHQSEFWALVERVIPDYKLRRKRLKIYQEKIASETLI
ncbi:MAG: M48 family metallopeptidase [Filifactoraceae bacterium]